MPDSNTDVIIVGAGIAGLVCARELIGNGFDCQIYEAADRPGGRITSDKIDGFILDRGFQVFLTSYPEAKRVLDYPALELRSFTPGALVRYDGKFHRFSDPWRCPQHLWGTLTSPVASLLDKLRIARFKQSATSGSLEEVLERPETETIQLLRDRGFSSTVIDRFFRPFLGGVFLDADLKTSSRMCEFVFRMFSLGDATLPSDGMQAIPQQLAKQLPTDVLRLNCPVKTIAPGKVVLKSGEVCSAKSIVVAVDEPSADKLCESKATNRGQQTTSLYFAAESPPIEEPILLLNGDGQGPVNNVCIPSQVASGYAPTGQSLISVTTLISTDSDQLTHDVQRQLREWFGAIVDKWQYLRSYKIEYALPEQFPPHLCPVAKSPELEPGIFRCGDYCDTGSINGAMASGRRAAQAVIDSLGR